MALGGSPWTRTSSGPPYICLFVTAIESPDPSFYSWPCVLFLLFTSIFPISLSHICPSQWHWRQTLAVFLPGCHGGQCGWGWRQHSLLDKLFSQWLLGPRSPGYPPSGLIFLFHSPCFISISLASKKFSTFKTHLGNVLTCKL